MKSPVFLFWKIRENSEKKLLIDYNNNVQKDFNDIFFIEINKYMNRLDDNYNNNKKDFEALYKQLEDSGLLYNDFDFFNEQLKKLALTEGSRNIEMEKQRVRVREDLEQSVDTNKTLEKRISLLEDAKHVTDVLADINNKLPSLMELEIEDFYKRGVVSKTPIFYEVTHRYLRLLQYCSFLSEFEDNAS